MPDDLARETPPPPKPFSQVEQAIDNFLKRPPLEEERCHRIASALEKAGADFTDKAAPAYQEVKFGELTLFQETAAFLESLPRGLVTGLFTKKGAVTSGTDFVPILPPWTLGDIVGGIRSLSQREKGPSDDIEPWLKLAAAVFPGIPTGIAHGAIERFMENRFVAHYLSSQKQK